MAKPCFLASLVFIFSTGMMSWFWMSRMNTWLIALMSSGTTGIVLGLRSCFFLNSALWTARTNLLNLKKSVFVLLVAKIPCLCLRSALCLMAVATAMAIGFCSFESGTRWPCCWGCCCCCCAGAGWDMLRCCLC